MKNNKPIKFTHSKHTLQEVIYISGAMSSRLDTYKAAFAKAERELTERGYAVWNPANNPQGLDYEKYFPVCYAMIDASDSIYMLNGWSKSEGARRELAYAHGKGKNVYVEGEG